MLKKTLQSLNTTFLLSLILLLLIGCRTPDEDTKGAASVERAQSIGEESGNSPILDEAIGSGSSLQPAIGLSDELDLSFEIEGLRRLADQMDQNITFMPAEEADIGWLVEAGVPYDLLHFYALANPSGSFSANAVEIYPLTRLKELNETHNAADEMRSRGFLIIATTVIGDIYFVNANQADSSTIYLGSHDHLLNGITDSEFEEYSTLGAISIQQFLAKFMAGQLSYDFYEPEIVAADSPDLFVAPDSMETYENEELGIAVTLPVSWIVTGSFSGTGINLFGPGLDGEPFDRSQYISIERFNTAGSTESLPDEFIRYFENQAEVENVQLESKSTREINGILGEEIIFRYKISGQELVQQTVVLQQGQKTYALSLITAASQYGQPDDLSIADNIVDSFTLVNRE